MAATPTSSSSTNPAPLLRGEGLPPFEAISPEQVEQAIPALLAELNEELDQLEASLQQRLEAGATITWPELMEPLHHLGERLRWSWGW